MRAPDPRDLLSALARSAFSSTSGGARDLDEDDRRIRQSVSTSRRIGFAAVAGGSGTSATTAAVASVIARRRAGRVLAVDGAAGLRGTVWHLGLAEDARSTPASPVRRTARTSWQATADLPLTSAGALVVGLGDRDDPSRVPAPSRWADEVEPIARFHEVVVSDWGVRSSHVDLGDAARDSHVLAVVSRSERAALEEAVAVAGTVARIPSPPRVVVVVVDVGGVGHAAARLLRRRGDLDVPLVTLPWDAAKSADVPPSSRSLRPVSRRAHIELAAALVQASASPSDVEHARHAESRSEAVS
jgi:MinD-like ATPase involved in chromosome partitioning or flagellar assembly